jgi:hypothetical protein
MNDADLENYVQSLGYQVETVLDASNVPYMVVHDFTITRGSLAGTTCDVALARSQNVPYLCPPAVHTRPALVPMDMVGPLRTQGSPLGSDWQYWSRRFDPSPTPKLIWAHIVTVLTEV